MTATVADILSQSARQLAPVTDTPRLDAELLLAHVLNLSRASLLARLREPCHAPGFEALLARRMRYEPLAYILGEWEFFGLSMLVAPPLLTPRPETEHLVETVLDYLRVQPSGQIVADICCGTGCVAVALASNSRNHRVVAADMRRDAVEMTQRNAARQQAAVSCVQCDLLSAFVRNASAFDVIAANPPYVPAGEWPHLSPVITRHEDLGALLAGPDGLDVIRRLVPQAWLCLRPGGLLAMEIGEDQFGAVQDIMDTHGFHDLKATSDLAGIQRIISGIR